MLRVAVARSFTDGNAICYVFTVFLDDDMFPRMGENQKRRVCFVQFARWPNLGRSLPSPIASCLFKNALRIYKADIEENV